jgi:hypothetical protein
VRRDKVASANVDLHDLPAYVGGDLVEDLHRLNQAHDAPHINQAPDLDV